MEKIERVDWIKDLVTTEQKIEETGIVELGSSVDTQRILVHESLQFLLNLKAEFYEAANIFNELKTSPLGKVKIYGIAQTHADFMLFRNGYKMLFTIKGPGVLSIRMNFIGNNFMPTQGADLQQASKNVIEESLIEAKLGPFNEVLWTFKGQAFKTAFLVRHYLTLFIKESGTQ